VPPVPIFARCDEVEEPTKDVTGPFDPRVLEAADDVVESTRVEEVLFAEKNMLLQSMNKYVKYLPI